MNHFTLSLAAVSLYNDTGRIPTVSEICIPNDCSILDFYDHFPSREAAQEYFFATLPLRYQEMISELDGFEQLPPGEKLANFIYSTLDMLDEFPEASYDLFKQHNGLSSKFMANSRDTIRQLLETDSSIPSVNLIPFAISDYWPVAIVYQQILHHAVYQDSKDRQNSFALIEKLTDFFNEIITNAAIPKGMDLAKYVLQSDLNPTKLLK